MMKSYNKFVIPVLFVLLLAAYYTLIRVIPADYNDMHDHAAFARDMCTGKIPYTGNFLVYLLVNVFSFFTANVTATEVSLCLLLAFAGTYRYYIAQQGVMQVLPGNDKAPWASTLAGLCMLLVFVIPVPGYFTDDHFMYIGTYTPNVWHNSTILFLFPFALLLFDQSWSQIQNFKAGRNWILLLLIALNLFIKPSFFFVFVCVYPIMLLFRYRLSKNFWLGILPVVLGFAMLIAEFVIIYKTNSQVNKDSSSVVFMPFWRNPELREDMINIPISLLFSLFFPFLYAVLNIRRILYNRLFWYVFLSFAVSVLIFFFISESGPRASHGNFYWQIIITVWICYFVSLVSLFRDINIAGLSFNHVVLLAVFGIHVLTGAVYLARMLLTGNYY